MDTVKFKQQDKIVAVVLGFVGILLLSGAGYGLFLLMPLLVDLAKNTIIFFAELAVLAFMALAVYQVWAERDLFILKWKNYVRNVRKAIIADDPIGVLSTAIKRFRTKLETIDERITEVVGARKTQDEGINRAMRSSEKEESLAAAAIKLNKPEREVVVHAVASKRWRDSAEKMRPMAELMGNMQTMLEGARDLASSTLADLENQYQVKSMEMETTKAGRSAVKSLKAFFGKTDDSDLTDMAFDEIERQTNEAEADIEQFMRVIDPALKSNDLSKQAETMEAMKRFQIVLAQKALGAASPNEPLVIEQVEPLKIVR